MLEVRDLTVSYGAVKAVRGVSVNIEAGAVVGLIGANGAGKSSLLEAISGMKRPIGGQVSFFGERIEALPSHAVMARGVAHVPENRLIFSRLRVGENLLIAAGAHMTARLAARQRDAVLEWIPELAPRLNEPASALSGGQQQLLAVGRGLMSRPKLLILDEPTLGLSPVAAASMFTLVAGLAASKTAVLIIDQNIQSVLAVSAEVHLVDDGRIVLSGPPSTLMEDHRIADTYLGIADQKQRGGYHD